MTDFFGYMNSAEVVNAKTFAGYVQQQLGTPYPAGYRIAALNKNINEFFTQYPAADYNTLVRTVEFCKARKKRPANATGVLAQIRFAFAAGYLPELVPKERQDDVLEEKIAAALAVERDVRWRDRLIASTGVDARQRVYVAWELEHHG